MKSKGRMLLFLALAWWAESRCQPSSPVGPVQERGSAEAGPELAVEANGSPRPQVVLWPQPKAPDASHPWLKRYPWLAQRSLWHASGCGPGQPSRAHLMGDFGVGNGHHFALLGYACPLNTLHSMVGPTYQKLGGFFHDTWIELRQGKDAPALQAGHVFRVRKSAILHTLEQFEGLSLHTITFAPMGKGIPEAAKKHAMLRVVWVENRGQSPRSGLELVFPHASSKRGKRQRSLLHLEATGPKLLKQGQSLALAPLAAGSSVALAFAYAMTEEGGLSLAALQGELKDADPMAWMKTTYDAWQAKIDSAAQLVTPDPRVNDFYTGLLTTLWVQRASTGGVSPMSRYTRFWTRDSIGPVRAWARVGWFEDIGSLLGYYHRVAAAKGQLQNSYGIDVPADPKRKPPDWSKLPPLQGRTAAEAPSYLPLMFRAHYQASGDLGLLKAHYGMLAHAITQQAVSAKGRLPFSGDETYRTALSMTLGLSLTHAFEDCCDSANSSFLFVAGALALADIAEALGKAKDASALRSRARQVREATERDYWGPQQAYLPFLHRASPSTALPPYPEVSTKPLWLGYHAPTSARALTQIRSLEKLLGKSDGFWQLPVADKYKNHLGLGLEQGLYTGMAPGYILDNLSQVDHPKAEKLFNALARSASSSGNFAEYQLYGDHAVFQIIYDKTGLRDGDVTARFRPWEGGIVLDAMVSYLSGFRANAPQNQVHLAPRLPNGWPQLTLRQLRVDQRRLDLQVTDEANTRTYRIELRDGKDLQLHFEAPLPTDKEPSVSRNGAPLEASKYTSRSAFGQRRLLFAPQTLQAKKPLEISITY